MGHLLWRVIIFKMSRMELSMIASHEGEALGSYVGT
jgi:hypothetical protein